MTRRALHGLAAASLLAGALLAVGATGAVAQSDDRPKPATSDDDAAAKAAAEKAKAETARIRKALEAVATDFQAERTARLIERIPEKAKVTLTIGTANQARVKRVAAKNTLDQWFRAKEVRKVGLVKHKGLVGIFELEYRAKGKDVIKTRQLDIELRASEDGKQFFLQRIELHRK